MTKKIRWSVGAILALIALLVAMFHRKIDGMKASLALGMSMIGAGITNIWQWLPENIAILSGLSGMILTWTIIIKNIRDLRKEDKENKITVMLSKPKTGKGNVWPLDKWSKKV